MAWKMSKANLTSGETGAYIEIPAATVGNGTSGPTLPIELQELYEKVQERPKLYWEKNKIPAGAGNGSGNGGGDSLDPRDYIQGPGVVTRFEEIGEREYAGGGQREAAEEHDVNEPWATYEYLYILGKDARDNSEIVLGRSEDDGGKQVPKETYVRYKTGDSCDDDAFENENDCPIYLKYQPYCVPTHLSTGSKITEYTLFAKGKWLVIPDYIAGFAGNRSDPTGCGGWLSLHGHCCGNDTVDRTTCAQTESDSHSDASDPIIQMQRRRFIREVLQVAAQLGLNVNFSNIPTSSAAIQIGNEVFVTPTGVFNITAVLKLDTAASDFICKNNKSSTIGLRFKLRAPSYSGTNVVGKTLNEDAHSCMAIELCSEVDGQFRTEVCNAPRTDCMDNMINCFGGDFCLNLSDFVGKTDAYKSGYEENWFRCPFNPVGYEDKPVYFTANGDETSSNKW